MTMDSFQIFVTHLKKITFKMFNYLLKICIWSYALLPYITNVIEISVKSIKTCYIFFY